jgi:hypothetical protein
MEQNNLNETKDNKFVRALKVVGKYFAQVFRDLGRAIKDKPSLVFGTLGAFPGIFAGLFMTFHVSAATGFDTSKTIYQYSGIFMFALILSGCLGIVTGVKFATGRSLKSCIQLNITSLIVIIAGLIWAISLMSCETIWDRAADGGIHANAAIKSITCVIISVATALIGSIGAWFTFDKNPTKD